MEIGNCSVLRSACVSKQQQQRCIAQCHRIATPPVTHIKSPSRAKWVSLNWIGSRIFMNRRHQCMGWFGCCCSVELAWIVQLAHILHGCVVFFCMCHIIQTAHLPIWSILPAQTNRAEIFHIKCFVCNDPLCHDYFMRCCSQSSTVCLRVHVTCTANQSICVLFRWWSRFNRNVISVQPPISKRHILIFHVKIHR